MANVIIFNICLIASCAYALAKGGAPERIVAVLLLAAAGGTFVVQLGDVGVFHAVELDILAIDVALLIALMLVTVGANRFWPLWMTAFHGLTLMVHAAKAYEPSLIPLVYGVVVGKLAYPMLAVLAVGTWRHRRRVERFGADISWRSSFSRFRQISAASGRHS